MVLFRMFDEFAMVFLWMFHEFGPLLLVLEVFALVYFAISRSEGCATYIPV